MENIPKINLKRVVILGGGFAGLKLASKLRHDQFQVVLIDKNNYHQFQPLFYQVATAGLEPSAISFPFRKLFHNTKNIHFRLAQGLKVLPDENSLVTDQGTIEYDYLVIATGADTNYYGNIQLKEQALGMKTTAEALYIRNRIIENYEKAIYRMEAEASDEMLNIVIVGGGPTGVELSGALAEMKTHILPNDYPEIDFSKMRIFLIDGSSRLLSSMSEASSASAKIYLEQLGVEIIQNEIVSSYKDNEITLLKSQKKIKSSIVLWAAGITPNMIEGLDAACYDANKRILVNNTNQIIGFENIYALGDNTAMHCSAYPSGHPQVAGVAQQQAIHLAHNLNKSRSDEFVYKDRGSMATVGRNLAVVELPFLKLQGIIAWFIWMFVHLMLILGVKNRLLIFINWSWSYITFDPSLRLLIKPVTKEKDGQKKTI